MARLNLLVLIASVLVGSVYPDNSVYTISKLEQIITSTTLKWTSHSQYNADRAFVIGGQETVNSSSEAKEIKRSIFVCRALHNGVWVAGGQRDGDKKCAVALTGTAALYENYELLENVDQAARLYWADWDKFSALRAGSVVTHTSVKMFVARYNASSDPNSKFSFFVGTLNREENFGRLCYVNANGVEATAENGQVLVEIEPIRYELKDVRVTKKTSVSEKPVVLGTTSIQNSGTKRDEFAEAVSYANPIYYYWGQGHAIIKGLNTSIKLNDKTLDMPSVSWGIPYSRNETEIYTLKVNLEPGTGVNVTVRANYTEIDANYNGKLFSVYEDGARTEPRRIYGVLLKKGLGPVVAELSPVYFLSNFSLVPTSSPATTIMTTGSTSTTLLPGSGSTSIGAGDTETGSGAGGPYDPQLDDNDVGARKSEGSGGMQADGQGPQSLRNKSDDSAGAAAAQLSVPLMQWSVLTCILMGLASLVT